MKSAIPENITHEELVSLLRAGTFPFDFNGINPSGFAQLGQGLTKENLLDDATEITIWGDARDRTVNQALQKLALAVYAGEGMIVNVTVVNDAGEPFVGTVINGLYDSSANAMVTNAEGKATGYTTSTTTTLSISGYYDIEDVSLTVVGDRGSTQDVTMTVKRRNYLSITETQSKMFSPFCKRVDVTAVGGGGGGGAGDAYRYGDAWSNPGAGGAGGDVVVRESVVFAPFAPYLAIIGAGGAGAMYTNTGEIRYGVDGGTSSFLGVSAAGGSGGRSGGKGRGNIAPTTVGPNGNGGAGASGGESGTAGHKYGYTSFDESSLFGGGGSGGTGYGLRIPGATPYGGDGGHAKGATDEDGYYYIMAINGYDAKGPGGGGGGGAAYLESDDHVHSNGGAGYRGVVNIRMHH